MDEILRALMLELEALGADVRRGAEDTRAFVMGKAAELRAIGPADPGFAVAVDMAKRACVMRAYANGIIAADRADDRAWDAAFGVALRVAAAAAAA